MMYRRSTSGFGSNAAQPYSDHNAWYETPGETCAPFGGLVSDCNGSFERSRANIDTERFAFRINCWEAVPAPGCYPATPGQAPHYRLERARFTLRDVSAPQAASARGSLTGSGAHRGSEVIGAQVSDTGGGVYRTIISVDGQRVSTTAAEDNNGRCVDATAGNADPYEFLYPQPCSLDTQVEARLDTTSLAEGGHSFEVIVEDAAGNSTTPHDSSSFLVDNVPDPQPVAPVNQVPAITAPAAVPAAPGTPAAAGRGPGNGSAPSDTARVSAFFGKSTRTTHKVGFGRATKIQGRLIGPNGQPIANAALAVMTRVQNGSSRLVEAGKVTTDEQGRYGYTLAAGPTRTVRFAYRAYGADSQFADTSDVQVKVVAKASLKAAPRKLRNGQKVIFRGSVLGGHVPSAGLGVDLQVRQGRQWRTFGVAKASKRGKFSYGYRFKRTFKPTTYTFRALVRGDSSFPYVPGASNRARVSVR